jgi:tRNA(Ile)-lysidine synthase
VSTIFTPQQVLARIGSWPRAPRFWVAFSGGVDSRVLLEVMAASAAQLPGPVSAIHVDHGLHPRSPDWARHCAGVCERLRIPFVTESVNASAPAGASPEAWARRMRYRALRRHVGVGEMLLTAHHLDDQAETVLLQLFRGGGPAGLAGMPPLRPFAAGHHGRPLLEFSRAALREWAAQARLDWIEDESNVDPRFDRNFLRREILPLLATRWPGLAATLAKAAELQAQTASILAAVADQDLRYCAVRDALDVGKLLELGAERRANAVREWLRRAGLPLPGAAQLRLLDQEVIGARPDRIPCLRWPGAEVRRYRARLYAMAPPGERDPRAAVRWRLSDPLPLRHGILVAERGAPGDLRADACAGGEVEIRFRKGGERLKPAGSAHTRDLRTLFQERGVPPWARNRIPLLYIDGKLAVVPGLWVDSGFSAGASSAAWRINWKEAGVAATEDAGS